MPIVEKLMHDQWIVINHNQEPLFPNDYVRIDGRSMHVKDAFIKNDRLVIKPHIYGTKENPIIVNLHWQPEYINTASVADDLCSTVTHFNDGTAMIFDPTSEKGYIYSPRLPEEELEKFVIENAQEYERFMDENDSALNRSQEVYMKPFW